MTQTPHPLVTRAGASTAAGVARRVLLGSALAYFMVLLDMTVLAVAEPALVSSLGTDVVGVAWATTSYTMALAAAVVLGGTLTDRVGAWPVFVTASGLFGATSLCCAAAPSIAWLAISRAVLGLCAAAIIPSSLALVAALHPGTPERTRAIGVWAAISGAAMAAGPVLGGVLVEQAGWRAVFVVNAPLSVLVVALCRGRVATPRHRRPISVGPHLGVVASLAAGTLAITEAGRRDVVLAWLATGVAVSAATLTARADRRSRSPILPSSLRRNRSVLMTLGWGAAVSYALATVLFTVPLALPDDPTTTGVTLLPMTLLMAVNPLVTSRLVARRGALLPIRLGFCALVLGLGSLAASWTGSEPDLLRLLGLLCCGLGVSWVLPSLVGFAIGHAPADAVGALGGVLNAARQVGATLGAAVASAALADHRGGSHAALPLVGAAALCGLALLRGVTPTSRTPSGP